MYKNLREVIDDLQTQGQLLRITQQVDPELEMAEIQRQVYAQQGPAILFENIKNCRYPALSNLFGTEKRAEYLLRDSLPRLRHLVAGRSNPASLLKDPIKTASLIPLLLKAPPLRLPKGLLNSRFKTIKLNELPMIKSWPDDGGAFITLPQVYSEHPDAASPWNSNLGMYRIQISGNEYLENQEVGMHYQLHRTIGQHHAAALKKGQNLKISIFVGGPPAHSLAAVMPLPDHISEVVFCGLLANRNFRYLYDDAGHLISYDADFVITGEIDGSKTKPEGPFGDHLGYYSLTHEFPVMKVHQVYAREDAIWPFTVVGRPPQEDSSFGALIHSITEPAVGKEIPGVKSLHAVDEAGVHPLLLALGSERYTPYESERKPQEILTQANAILGFGQCSLAKYLFIMPHEDVPHLDINDCRAFIHELLQRIDFQKDLHFQTQTTMDTLDYSGTGINSGSKVVLAAAGPAQRKLATNLPADLIFEAPIIQVCFIAEGILAIKSQYIFKSYTQAIEDIERLTTALRPKNLLEAGFPLIILCDDAEFLAASYANFLWACFTKSNPSHDIYGIDSTTQYKHWGCKGSLIIDARRKPHHAPDLIEHPEIKEKTQHFLSKQVPFFDKSKKPM